MSDLGERVTQFDLLQLPGQPQFMHMGTSYLVHDLWRRVQKLERVYEAARDHTALWERQKIEGLPRAERNAALEETREKLIAAVRGAMS